MGCAPHYVYVVDHIPHRTYSNLPCSMQNIKKTTPRTIWNLSMATENNYLKTTEICWPERTQNIKPPEQMFTKSNGQSRRIRQLCLYLSPLFNAFDKLRMYWFCCLKAQLIAFPLVIQFLVAAVYTIGIAFVWRLIHHTQTVNAVYACV